MAAAVTTALAPVTEKAKEVFDKAKADPILWVSDLLIKGGAVIFLLGAAAYFLSQAAKRSAQGFVTDIDNTLGISQEIPPTPPRKTVPQVVASQPYYVLDIATIVGTINDFSKTNGPANFAAATAAVKACDDLRTNATASGAPNATLTDIENLRRELSLLQSCFDPAEYGDRPNWNDAYEVIQGPVTVNWANFPPITVTSFPPTYEYVNKVEYDFGLVATYDIQQTPDSTSGPQGVFGAIVTFTENFTTGLLVGGFVGAIVNVVSGGSFAQGFQTVSTNVNNAVQGAGNLVSSIAGGLGLIGKAIISFPRLLLDSVGYAGSWAGEMILDAIYTPMLVAGAVMFVAGSGLKFGYTQMWPKVESRVILAANARGAKVWNWLDARLGTRKNIKAVNKAAALEAQVEAANARATPEVVAEPIVATPPVIDAGRPAEAKQTEPEKVGGAVPTTANEPSPEPPTAPASNTPAENSHEKPTPLSETPVPPEGTTAATEKFLGENPTRAPTPEELKTQEANRQATMPPPPGPSYKQRKEEREHSEAERLLALGDGWASA
jgi:hypothetical protein